MSYQKLQGYIAVEVLPSDNANIPFPGDIVKGQVTAVGTDKLIDTSGVSFTKNGVDTGDIVYNVTLQTAATVLKVSDSTSLILNSNIMLAVGDEYIIYPASQNSGAFDANNGCVLYVGVSGDLEVTTIGGSKVSFKNMPVGFVPVQVKKIWSTDTAAKEIIALW